MELAPRDADHLPAGGGEEAVAGAVALEGSGVVVGGAAVKFDYEASIGPDAVALDQPVADVNVEVRPREPE